MNNLSVLFLGWNFLPQEDQEPETNCYQVAKAMANRVGLSLIIPKANPEVVLKNVNLTGLNNVDFSTLNSGGRLPKPQPFAEADYIRQQIPLYGSPNIPANQRSYSSTPVPESKFLKENLPAEDFNTLKTKVMDNFDPLNWDNITVDAQIIEYARFATRYASNRSYDVIFASNWLTFLAGNELRLVTGKPLAIQVQSLSQDQADPNNQGWRFELEKMAIQHSDYIFTATPKIASTIEEAFQIAPDKILPLADSTNGKQAEAQAFNNTLPMDNSGSFILPNDSDQTSTKAPSEDFLNWELKLDKMVDILLKLPKSIV